MNKSLTDVKESPRKFRKIYFVYKNQQRKKMTSNLAQQKKPRKMRKIFFFGENLLRSKLLKNFQNPLQKGLTYLQLHDREQFLSCLKS